MTAAMLHPGPPAQARPSPVRIGVGSAVLAAHAGLLLMMSLAGPGDYTLPQRRASPPMDIELITRAPPPPAPPPPMPAAPARPRTQAPPASTPAPVVVPPVESAFVIEAPAVVDTRLDASTDIAPVAHHDASVAGAVSHGSLSLLHAPPPPYPARARRYQWQGEVVLRIHVGGDGFPREVHILRSSGHGELDRSARAHVLRHWRFAALQREAIGDVPIRFALDN